ncbi:hypothetical protein ACIBG5_23165 [Kribbella sp. NPDC050241]|uniref:hypothetical protein n=1 Tax=Kribbella sp. NPDC050241 TaxID=3364115 RepID=UPI00379D00B1
MVAREDARSAVGRVLWPICAAIMALHVVAVAVRTLLRPGGGVLADVLSLLNAAQERSLASWRVLTAVRVRRSDSRLTVSYDCP